MNLEVADQFRLAVAQRTSYEHESICTSPLACSDFVDLHCDDSPLSSGVPNRILQIGEATNSTAIDRQNNIPAF